MLGNGKIHLQ